MKVQKRSLSTKINAIAVNFLSPTKSYNCLDTFIKRKKTAKLSITRMSQFQR
ncbi:hypothetical protein [Nostoc piscinale]|uniref:hypothetical protein n=1 Tax=Nostoc piscinale TaxID=224012 RepID=UPI000A9D82D9|nr:hypothetical protein [Nostoc piscinale]